LWDVICMAVAPSSPHVKKTSTVAATQHWNKCLWNENSCWPRSHSSLHFSSVRLQKCAVIYHELGHKHFLLQLFLTEPVQSSNTRPTLRDTRFFHSGEQWYDSLLGGGNLSQEIWCPSWVSNWAPPKYKSRALALWQLALLPEFLYMLMEAVDFSEKLVTMHQATHFHTFICQDRVILTD
jgi:hypothetical protein